MLAGLPENIFPLNSFAKTGIILGTDKDLLIALASVPELHYRPYTKKQIKDNGTIKLRDIDNPQAYLKRIQTRIHKRLLVPASAVLPSGVMGGMSKKSNKTNAAIHLGQEMVVTLDIANCYPSTTHQQTFKVWRNHFGCGTRLAKVLTDLTVYNNHLPQGAPTSSLLCNFVLLPLFLEIKQWCDARGLKVTIYVDDITVSGKREQALEAIGFIKRVVVRYGYEIKYEKINKMPARTSQNVTGISVHQGVMRVPSDKIDKFRKEIIKLADWKDQLTEGDLQRLRGRLTYVRNTNAAQGKKMEQFIERLLGVRV